MHFSLCVLSCLFFYSFTAKADLDEEPYRCSVQCLLSGPKDPSKTPELKRGTEIFQAENNFNLDDRARQICNFWCARFDVGYTRCDYAVTGYVFKPRR